MRSFRVFKAACNPDWESGRTNTIKLEKEDPDIVPVFLGWCYNDVIDVNEVQTVLTVGYTDTKSLFTPKRWEWYQLTRAYVLGDFLLSSDFKNTIMNELVRISKSEQEVLGANSESIELTFGHTMAGSALRQLTID